MDYTPEPSGWHEWLCKTNFSFLTGASHPHELIQRAWSLGYQSLCINDYDGVYGLARSWRALRDLRKEHPEAENFRLHYGAELHLREDHHKPTLLRSSVVLVAQNLSGWHKLCGLLSLSHQKSKDKAFISPETLLKTCPKDLVLIQPMRGGIRTGHQNDLIPQLHQHFGERFYMAISRHLHPAEDHWIGKALSLAHQLKARCLFSQDVFFHSPERKPLSDLLHAIRQNQSLHQAGPWFFPNTERSFQSLRHLHHRYHCLPGFHQAMGNAVELSRACTFDLTELRYHYPQEMIPDGHSPHQWLSHLTREGAKLRFGPVIPEKIIRTLNHELKLIEQLDFADYFLTVHDIVRWARDQKILCQGRGSAANSAVCFVLGITSVNPDSFELLFERFISMERGDPPDIDVDFEHERREEVIRYIYERYGRHRAAMVANVITFRKKGSLRAAGKALGIPSEILDHASSLAGRRSPGDQGISALLTELKTRSPEKAGQVPWDLWSHMSSLLRGFPRHLGIHSGGFMLSDKPLDQLLPREPATMEGRSVIQWCKDDIEALGFFKIDILALGMLTAIRKALDGIHRLHGIRLDLSDLPKDDPQTWQMLQRADTVGTFQVESRAQMSMLPRLRPATFYDLVIQVAIIRPGPLQGKVIHPFLRRRNSLEPVTYPSKTLEPILKRTLGVAIFQEQAMRIAIAVGNFTPGEANELRKNIGAWNLRDYERDLNPWLTKLAQGMQQNGFDQAFIHQILGQMRGFSDYGFPESHAVSFALIAWASSWIKCHYPSVFFASVMNSQPMGFYSPHSLLQAAQHSGVRVLPVCVRFSEADHLPVLIPRDSGPPLCGIRIGFRLITGLSANGIKKLLESRRQCGGDFTSAKHFFRNIRISRPDLCSLAAARALDCFGLSRQDALWKAEAAPYTWMPEVPEREIHWKQESPWERMKQDFRAFRTSTGPHPATLVRQNAWPYPVPLSRLSMLSDLLRQQDGSYVLVFGMIMARQAPPSANGMVFITLEDENGFINLACPPQVWQKIHQHVEGQNFICVGGRLQKVHEGHSVLVQQIIERISQKADIHKIQKPGNHLSPFRSRGSRGKRSSI